MFDKFYLTVNFKSKVSGEIFKNKRLSIDIYIFNFGLHNILETANILNNQNIISICNQKKELSIERKYSSISQVSPNVEDGHVFMNLVSLSKKYTPN